MRFVFQGEIWFWRGPSPFHFVTVPVDESAEVRSISALVSYGWGVIPVVVQIGGTTWTTSMIPQSARYLVPVKVSVRTSESLDVGDVVELTVTVGIRE